jgi:phospholipid/cholesterol/gamma-HCH transport system permease protein
VPEADATVERSGHIAVVRMRGDVTVPTARTIHGTLRALCKRRDVDKVVLDFADVGRLDSAGVAVVGLMRRTLGHAGKQLELRHLDEMHASAFRLAPAQVTKLPPDDRPRWLESIGEHVIALAGTLRALATLLADIVRQTWAVAIRRRHMPSGAVSTHVLLMGSDAVFIVGLLSFLLGMTLAFQGAVQLDKFGAGVFVADMVGWSMVREFAPLMTAIVLTGRTGAAIAAELGAMRVNSEIDALVAMGVSPVRFLVLPRLAALTFVGPALTLISTFVGIAGGLLVAVLIQGTTPTTFWNHIVERVEIADFAQGIAKSFAFAWIIGLVGSHLGLRATGDASSVGRATTRAVVVSIFFVIVVDAMFATTITLAGGT